MRSTLRRLKENNVKTLVSEARNQRYFIIWGHLSLIGAWLIAAVILVILAALFPDNTLIIAFCIVMPLMLVSVLVFERLR